MTKSSAKTTAAAAKAGLKSKTKTPSSRSRPSSSPSKTSASRSKTASRPAAKTSARQAAGAASKPAAKTTSKSATDTSAKARADTSAGKKAPEFSAEATGARTVSSRSLAGKPFVLYFYPKDDTPGCTAEGRDFAAKHEEFRRLGVEVLGVSRDGLASHEKFKAKHGLPFDLIADPDETLCRLFDVIREKSLYGRKFLGVERSTFLVDAAGVVVREWRKVKVNGHVENVLQAVRSL